MRLRRCLPVYVLLAIGCANSGTETDNPAASEGIEFVRSDAEYLTSSDVSDSEFEAVQKAQRTFALDLYREIADSSELEDNLLVSPYSVATTLSMTYAGARGNTRDEMMAVLRLGDAADALHPTMNAVANSLRKESERSAIELELFNTLWVSNALEPEGPFLDTLSEYYDTGVYRVDFYSDPELARERINSWASDSTRGTIEDLLPDGSVDRDTRLALTHAVFFAAHWKDPFDPETTEDAAFTLESGSQVSVPMMGREWSYAFAFRTDWRAVELPYVDSQVSMIFVLPNQGELSEFDAAFDEARLSEIVAALGEAKADDLPMLLLQLPRFAFDSSTDLAPRLGSLGMKDAFSTAADFTGMASEPTYIETAVHKSHIAIDEYGTVASAATAEVLVPMAVAPRLSFDRPFVFFIYDHGTDTVLFVGRLSDPGGKPVSGEPVTTPSNAERICALLADCPDRTTTVDSCQASFEGDDPAAVDRCADCLQVRKDLCWAADYCSDGGVSVCDASACADECPAHEF